MNASSRSIFHHLIVQTLHQQFLEQGKGVCLPPSVNDTRGSSGHRSPSQKGHLLPHEKYLLIGSSRPSKGQRPHHYRLRGCNAAIQVSKGE